MVQEPPVPLRHIHPEIPSELEAMCLRCLSKDPRQRYPSAAALAEALRTWAGRPAAPGEGIVPVDFSASLPNAPPEQPPPKAAFPTRARRPAWVAAAVVGLVLLVACLILFRFLPRGEQSPDSSLLADKGGLSRPTRRDFEVSVELVGSVEGPQGERLLDEGQHILLRLTVARDAYVAIWTVDHEGVVTQLFPNDYEPEYHVLAGAPYTIPGKNARYRIDADLSKGLEQLRVVAQTRRWNPIQGEKQAPFAVFAPPRTAPAGGSSSVGLSSGQRTRRRRPPP